MKSAEIHPRFIQGPLIEALADSPVVLIHGPRQCGKSTLALGVGAQSGHSYISFDDETQRASAVSDPQGFVADLPAKVILDEVQRVPEIFTSIKAAVDKNRLPGRFILTGSSNVLLLPKLADSLAGRMEILRLHPLSQTELNGKPSRFLTTLFEAGFKAKKQTRLGKTLADIIVAGGYPAALARSTEKRRAIWYRDYIETLLQRDIRDLARISALDALPRLMTLAAGQTARLLNVADLAAPFHLSRPTIREYITLLERIFLLEELPPWHSNRLSRLIKTPKLHLADTGLACALLGIDANMLWSQRNLLGPLLETFVYQELRRQASWHPEPINFHHFRDKDGVEVDIVLESGRKIAGIEIKASATATSADFKSLRKLQEATGKNFAGGVVLYDGEALTTFGNNLYAVPVSALWN